MPEDDSTLRGMLAGMKDRRQLVHGMLEIGEEIKSDSPAYCVAAPESNSSSRHPGHLVAATRHLIYVPEGEAVQSFPYEAMEKVSFIKQQRGWVVVEIRMKSGDLWALTTLPRTGRIARRLLKEINSSALSP